MGFPAVDLHALTASWGVDLAAGLVDLKALYDDVDARNARNTAKLQLPCYRGCDMCCHESVFLTPLEFFYVWDWAQRTLPAATRDAMIAQGLASYETHKDLITALNNPPPDGARDHFAVAQRLRFRCPLLGSDGTCSVYPARELLARLFGCSFNDASGVYGCYLVGRYLADQTVTLLPARGTVRRLQDLPLTRKRQVYPYYFHALFGPTPQGLSLQQMLI